MKSPPIDAEAGPFSGPFPRHPYHPLTLRCSTAAV